MPGELLEQQGGLCNWTGGCEGREEDMELGVTQAIAGTLAFPVRGVESHCSVLSREVACSD